MDTKSETDKLVRLLRLTELSNIPELILNVEEPYSQYYGVERTDYSMPLIKEVEDILRHYDPSLTRFCNFTNLPRNVCTPTPVIRRTGTCIRYLSNYDWPENRGFEGVAYIALKKLLDEPL